MTMQWCPKCQKMQNVWVGVSEESREEADHKVQKVTIHSSYCSVCQSFLASQEEYQEDTIHENIQ